MASRIGQTVSHYKILQKLGEGGMGVVYKAEDLKLARTVALKFLSQSLDVHEPDRARFLQEARTAAILNHPNICTIHDVAEAGEQQFIVMECVEGKRLSEIVPVKKMQDAIGYAIQIAEALQAAHEKGIVHRDIKTENIMITSKNQVKVMDFGLAKLKGSLKITKTSGPIGTLTHMSPEHILGGEVDARSDIFSFGIVLYEMLTGHLPFRGEHEAAMVFSIVNEEPEPLQHYIPDAPSELLHIVNRALEKDREDRYQTVHEMLIDLRRLKKDSSRLSPLQPQYETRMPATAAAAPGTEGKKASRKRLWMGVAGLVVLCIIAVLLLMPQTHRARLNPNRTTVTLQVPFKFILLSALSADGKWVVFPAEDENGRWDVYLMNVAGGKPRRVTEEAAYRIESVDISPDMSQIVYDCWDSPNPLYKIKIISSQGGGSRTLADTGAMPHWHHDGKRIGYIRRWPVMVRPTYEFMSIQPDGNDDRLEFTDSLTTSGYASYGWSPDGGSIAWVRYSEGGYSEVMIRELATGKERQLTHDRKIVGQLAWAANDEILFVSNKSGQTHLWMIPASGGEETQVVQGSVPVMNVRSSADNSTLMYTEVEEFFHIVVSDIDGTRSRDVISQYGSVTGGALSPDGNHIAHVIENLDLYNQDAHLFVVDRDGKNQRQLTTGSQRVFWCRWSPDGKWLAYYSLVQGEHGDSGGVYAIQPFNLGRPRLLFREGGFWWVSNERFVAHVSPKTLLYSMNGGAATQVYQDSMEAFPIEGNKQLVFFDHRKGREGWWVTALDAVGSQEGQGRKILGDVAVYLPYHMRFLVYRRGDAWWRVWTSTGKEERVGNVIPGKAQNLALSPDGKEILWATAEYRSRLVLVKDVFE